ncbi:hypothetical protein L195_g037417, partial [Trifolium pratense]
MGNGLQTSFWKDRWIGDTVMLQFKFGAVIWALWRHRNKIVFENGITDVIGLVEEVTEPPTITISKMANFGSRILDAVDNFPTSTVKIMISERLKDSEYDAIVDFIDNTNDNLKRTALKLVRERVGNDAAGQQK